MAKKNYVVLCSGTYGKKGKVIELDLGKEGLTKRQSVLLKLYAKPVVMADESKQLTEAKANIVALEAEVKELTEAKAEEKPKDK